MKNSHISMDQLFLSSVNVNVSIYDKRLNLELGGLFFKSVKKNLLN